MHACVFCCPLFASIIKLYMILLSPNVVDHELSTFAISSRYSSIESSTPTGTLFLIITKLRSVCSRSKIFDACPLLNSEIGTKRSIKPDIFLRTYITSILLYQKVDNFAMVYNIFNNKFIVIMCKSAQEKLRFQEKMRDLRQNLSSLCINWG